MTQTVNAADIRYPPIEPFNTGTLQVSSVHTLYYEQCGNPNGKPVVFLHGGPGGGISADDRRFFDPTVYRAVLFDQRGAGKSTPMASLEDNTTWHLVDDIEKLRAHLGIERWVVFGGSWGSTLALAYAQTHPDRVKALVLRGIFLLGREELEFFYQQGSSWIFPEAWDEYLAAIPEVEHGDLISAYYRRLTSNDETVRQQAAAAWSKWECTTSRLYVDPELVKKASNDKWADAFARIECHYFVNGGWFKRDLQLLHDIHKIKHIPAVIVQGRYDMVCPARTAWALHKKWPEAEFHMVPDAGHSAREPGIAQRLVEACNKFREL